VLNGGAGRGLEVARDVGEDGDRSAHDGVSERPR
jgi:hypothetical protein